MTRAQIILRKYIKKNFADGAVTITDIGDDKVRITDHTGESMTLTMNIYCDIMDADTKKIHAVSDLPHDLRHIGVQLPNDWTEIYES